MRYFYFLVPLPCLVFLPCVILNAVQSFMLSFALADTLTSCRCYLDKYKANAKPKNNSFSISLTYYFVFTVFAFFSARFRRDSLGSAISGR